MISEREHTMRKREIGTPPIHIINKLYKKRKQEARREETDREW